MASTPKFNTPKTSPPASGWQPGHRPPALGYGNLDGVCTGGQDLPESDRRSWPDNDDGPGEY